MSHKYNFFLAWLAALLFAGCATDNHPIELNDEYHPVQAQETHGLIPSKEPSLQKSELTQIEMEVFSCLLSQHLADDGQISSIFIESEEERTKMLLEKFPRHVPPIKQWWHLDKRSGQSPLDLDTGRSAMILSADILDPENGTVTAVGKWFAGGAVSGFYTFELRKVGDGWAIKTTR